MRAPAGLSALGPPLRATRPRRKLVALSVLLGAGAVLAAVGLLATSGYLISRAAERPEILALSVAIVGVRFFGMARALLRYLERLVSHQLAFSTLGDLRRRFFRALIPLVPGGLQGRRRAELLSGFVADVDRLQDLYLRALAPPMIAALAGSAALVIAALMLPAAAAVLAAFLVVAAVGVPALTRLAARAAGRRQAPARARLSADLVEALQGAPEIALAGREREWIERVEGSSRILERIQVRDALAGGIGTGAGTLLTVAAMVAVTAVAVAAHHAGGLDGVLIAALALLAFAAFEAVTPLSDAAASVDACAAAAERLERVSSAPAAIADPESPDPVPSGGSLELSDVWFRYGRGSDWVLRGARLVVEPGEAVAVVGPSGSGKSTLAELAVRFLDPVRGQVLLGGVDTRRCSQDAVRRSVRLGSQDAHMFATTIHDNLAIARPSASEAEMAAAIGRVGLGEWLASLPDGLGTQVGEQGARISGGQRQRLGAARLLLSGAPFLIFDEPTAHLDQSGARALLAELAGTAEREGCGVLVITHEPDSLDPFDRVLALRRGALETVAPAPA